MATNKAFTLAEKKEVWLLCHEELKYKARDGLCGNGKFAIITNTRSSGLEAWWLTSAIC